MDRRQIIALCGDLIPHDVSLLKKKYGTGKNLIYHTSPVRRAGHAKVYQVIRQSLHEF
jgi:hypothetical protein